MGIFNNIAGLFRSKESKSILNSLEDILLEAGLTPKLVYDVLEKLNEQVGAAGSEQKIIATLKTILSPYAVEYPFVVPQALHIYMFIGVNGVGKTTSIAKFIYYLINTHHIDKKNILVAAGDTFRAGAIEQLQKHCNALDVSLIKQSAGADPAAVLYDALQCSKANNIPILIADTAGRMNNRKDLIAQLQKIYRLLYKDTPLEHITSYIVLDGNSGLNTVSQVNDFMHAVPLEALILSKYDGSTKGGSILSVYQKCKVPCAFLGTGEKYQNWQEFKQEEFLDEFLEK